MKKLLLVFGIALACSTTAGAIEIAISTHAGWWSQAAADRETKIIVDSVKGATVKLFDATQQVALADWVRSHTNDGRPDLLILCGRFPASIYPNANLRTDGSLAELFLDAGNCIINTGDWIFYVPSSGSNNGSSGLVNMTDRSALSNMSADNTLVAVTADGKKYTPSLPITSTDRPFFLDQLGGDWYAELILAQNTAGNRADPAIITNRATGGRVGIFYQKNSQDDLPRGKVISEWINNWYLPVVAHGGQALGPAPAEKATDILQDTVLSWKPGQFGGTHDVYFGTVRDNVDAASRTDKKGVLVSQGQADATFKPTLDYGKTYYWRIDEVNKTPDNTVFKGSVWSFTVEPYGYRVTPTKATASSAQANMGPENTINSSGMTGDLHGNVETTMWLTTGAAPNWIQYEFDNVYKLYEMVVWNSNQQIEMMLGFGAKTVTVETSLDATTWTAVKNVPEFAKAPGAADYAANTTVSMGGVDAKFVKLTIAANWGGLAPQTGLSEVRFSYAPTQARSPQPALNATGANVDAKLAWRPGRGATSHKVSFGTDGAAVLGGTGAKTVTDHGFDPGALNFGATYYWKVDEIGAATYPGSIWAFTTQLYQPIDDFESYRDQKGDSVFDIWSDGATNGSGSVVGLFPDAVNGTFCDMTIRRGVQSMPFEYNNVKAPFYSETTRTFDTPQDWTANGASFLSLWVRGWPVDFVDKGNGAFTIGASGHDIWDAGDDFRFVYKKLTGDGSIVVKVDSLLGSTNTWAKAGVMIRQSLEAGSPMVDMIIANPNGANGANFQWRATAGVAAVSTNSPSTPNIKTPQWVKLTRKGNVFSGQYSADGVTWLDIKNPALTGTPVTATVNLMGDVYIGLCLTSHDRVQTAAAEFSGAATTGTVTGAWQQAWIGVDPDRTSDPAGLYVTVADGAGKSVTVAHPDPAATNLNAWTEWRIPLGDFKGVNLAAVKKLTIGAGDRANPKAGGNGKLYIDDVQRGGLPALPAPAGLVAAYSFEDNVKDSTAHGYHGTILGAPTFVAGLPAYGKALKLNGTTDCVDLGQWWPAFNFQGSLSLSVWANIGAWTSNWNHVMVSNRGESGIGWQLRRRDSNKICFTTRGIGQDDLGSTKDAPLNEWVHIAGVYDSAANTKRIYVNGVEDAFVATSFGKLMPTTHNVYIGCRANSGNTGREGYFTGMLDEIKIYDIALTPAEVLKLAGK